VRTLFITQLALNRLLVARAHLAPAGLLALHLSSLFGLLPEWVERIEGAQNFDVGFVLHDQ
jgi:hypothetical protein